MNKLTLSLIGVSLIFLFFLILDRVNPIDLKTTHNLSKVVKSSNEEWLYTTVNRDDKWRFNINLQEIDSNFLNILLAYEDKRFYSHYGVDILAMSRAIWQLIDNKRVVSGGSTITMQLARLLHPRERTITSKLIEILRAFQLEWNYSKDEILSAYLTLTPYGGNIEGVVAGSMRYFGKRPYALSADEIALLISLPQSPEKNRPDKNPKQSKKSRDKILALAEERGLINSFEYQKALLKPTPKTLYSFPRYAPHLAQKLPTDSKTTIDYNLQIQLEKWALSKSNILPKDTTLALLVIQNSNSSIKAYIGSHNIFSKKVSGYIDMIRAIRSPASTLKPAIYAMGFEKHIIHPNTLILDEEIRFGDYTPHNFSNSYQGEVNIEYALQNSLNIPAVKVLQKVGVEDFTSSLKEYIGDLKIPKDRATLPIALGGLGLSIWQLGQLYVALANSGSAKTLHYLKSRESNLSKRIFSLKASKMTTSILRKTPPPDGFINQDNQIAYKTGTSYGYRDAWSVAYNSQYTVVMWVGKPNNAIQLRVTGREKAAPLAFEVFSLINSLIAQKQWSYLANYLGNITPNGLKYFDEKSKNREKKLKFIYPVENSRFRSAGCQETTVEIKIKDGNKPYFWYIDGIQKKIKRDSVYLNFDYGGHSITIIDSFGDTINRDIWIDKPEC